MNRLVLIGALLLCAGCRATPAASPTPDVGGTVSARVQQTVGALSTAGPVVDVGATATRGAAVSRTATVVAIATAFAPTATPTTPPPTVTPTPVPPSPTPRATPTPDARPAIQSYLTYLAPRLQTLYEAFTALGKQGQRMSINPRLYLDASWRLDTALSLVSIQTAGQQMQAYEPVPPELQTADDLVVSIGKDLELFVGEYSSGLDRLDSAQILRAQRRLELMGPRVERLTTELARVKREHGLGDGARDVV